MIEKFVISGLLFLGGFFNLYNGYRLLRNPKFARNYIENKPNAWLFRRLFGVEKSIKISRNIIAPLAILIGIIALTFGTGVLFLGWTL